MLRAARAFIRSETEFIRERLALSDGPRRVVLTGHSLDGGVSSLVAAIWRATPPFAHAVECFAFGPPPVLSHRAAERADNVMSVALRGDFVCSFSLASALDLRDMLRVLASEPPLVDRLLENRDDATAFADVVHKTTHTPRLSLSLSRRSPCVAIMVECVGVARPGQTRAAPREAPFRRASWPARFFGRAKHPEKGGRK